VLLRLAYLGVTNALATLWLLPMSDPAKDAEILALRHQITVLERQLQGETVRFAPADRAFLAALLHRLPRATCSAGSGCSYAQRPSAAGTATWSPDITLGSRPAGADNAVRTGRGHFDHHEGGLALFDVPGSIGSRPVTER
jgi:hypothetical protein